MMGAAADADLQRYVTRQKPRKSVLQRGDLSSLATVAHIASS